MPDYAYKQTDKKIKELEEKLEREYINAAMDVEDKAEAYFKKFQKKDDIWRKWVKDGKKTDAEYKAWRQGQMIAGKKWNELKDILAKDYLNANQIARKIIKNDAMDVYALNMNYATYQIEHGLGVNTSFSQYSHETVERLMAKNPDMLPPPGKRVSEAIMQGKDKLWNKQVIQSVAVQGILQGETIPDIATRLANAVCDSNYKAAVRNARTMCTGAQNAGRIDAHDRARALGCVIDDYWMSVHDNRTRTSHRYMDMEKRDEEGYFSNGCRFPGDPDGIPSEVYNCRCTILGVPRGFEKEIGANLDFDEEPEIMGMDYFDWLSAKPEYKPILSQVEKSRYFKQKAIDEYKGYPSKKKVQQATTKQGKKSKATKQSTPTKISAPKSKALFAKESAIQNAVERSEHYHIEKNFNQDRWDRLLAYEEQAAVRKYTGSAYRKMNGFMRELMDEDYVGDSIVEACRKCTDALEKCEVYSDTILYRGMGEKDILAKAMGITEEQLEQCVRDGSLKGMSFVEKGFCSTGITGGAGWDKDVMMEIVAPKGTKGMYVDPISHYEGEMELLLQQGTKFEIIDVVEKDWKYYIKCVIVGQNPKKV